MPQSNQKINPPYSIESMGDYIRTQFSAMASPCELLIETQDRLLAEDLSLLATNEVRRIEEKFSRYRQDNLCYAINNAEGNSVAIDEECHRLLVFANTCYSISNGLFDITSGVLRRIWKFDGGDGIPSQKQIDELMPLIGWNKVEYSERQLIMPTGMEIDFGGIGKEYAVSSVAQLCRDKYPQVSVLINLGGDIEVTKPREHDGLWRVGVEDVTDQSIASGILTIKQGALATSGDTKRFLLKAGKRYSHILNPKTGWPVHGAPSSVTVATQMCVQAGCLATIASLKGSGAEKFLKQQDAKFWISRV